MNRRQLLDVHYFQSRANLIDLAVFLDCLEHATGKADLREIRFLEALTHLQRSSTSRTERVLRSLGDRLVSQSEARPPRSNGVRSRVNKLAPRLTPPVPRKSKVTFNK